MSLYKSNHLVTDTDALESVRSWRMIGISTILCTTAAALLSILSSNSVSLYLILGLALLTVLVMSIFYFVSWFAENSLFSPIPDLVFISFITLVAVNMGDKSDFFIIFLIFALAVSAFSKALWSYLIACLGVMISMIVVFSVGGAIGSLGLSEIIIEALGVFAFAVLFRFLAAETNRLRQKEIVATEKVRQLLVQRRDIYLMIDNISEGIIAVDQDRKVTLINKAAPGILGLEKSLSHYVGKNIDDVFVAVSDDGKSSVVGVSLGENRAEVRDDIRIVRHDQTSRLHTESRPIIDEHKRAVGAIVLFRDITAQSEMEAQRAEFLAIASHELRTPLTVIEGYLYYLTSDKSLKYDKKTSEYLQKTYQAAEDLIHLSNDILAVTKSDEGHMVVNLEKVDIGKTLRESESKFRIQARNQGIKLLLDVPKGLPEVSTDRQKVTEVVTNLIENAFKFTAKGSVTLKAEVHEQKEVVISVIDTGIGISKADHSKIFTKFYRTEDWQTRKTGGTGLGLYIAKNYITRLGGRIGVTSQNHEGSTFWFSLPLGKIKKHVHNQDAQLHEFISNI